MTSIHNSRSIRRGVTTLKNCKTEDCAQDTTGPYISISSIPESSAAKKAEMKKYWEEHTISFLKAYQETIKDIWQHTQESQIPIEIKYTFGVLIFFLILILFHPILAIMAYINKNKYNEDYTCINNGDLGINKKELKTLLLNLMQKKDSLSKIIEGTIPIELLKQPHHSQAQLKARCKTAPYLKKLCKTIAKTAYISELSPNLVLQEAVDAIATKYCLNKLETFILTCQLQAICNTYVQQLPHNLEIENAKTKIDHILRLLPPTDSIKEAMHHLAQLLTFNEQDKTTLKAYISQKTQRRSLNNELHNYINYLSQIQEKSYLDTILTTMCTAQTNTISQMLSQKSTSAYFTAARIVISTELQEAQDFVNKLQEIGWSATQTEPLQKKITELLEKFSSSPKDTIFLHSREEVYRQWCVKCMDIDIASVLAQLLTEMEEQEISLPDNTQAKSVKDALLYKSSSGDWQFKPTKDFETGINYWKDKMTYEPPYQAVSAQVVSVGTEEAS